MRQSTLGFTHESTYRETDEWYTPPHVFEKLDLMFDLDPCSPLSGPLPWIPAQRFFTVADDGLSSDWEGRVWLNPPYGRDIGRWLQRLADHGNGVALLFARTDTEWFHRFAPLATRVCFIRKRLEFIDARTLKPADNAGAPSMLLAFDNDIEEENSCALVHSGLGIVLEAS